MVPGRQATQARKRANLGFGQARLCERGAHTELCRRPRTGPVVQRVISILTVQQRTGEFAPLNQAEQLLETQVLAVVTAIRRIDGNSIAAKLVQWNDPQRCPQKRSDLPSSGQLSARHQWRIDSKRRHASRTQSIRTHRQEIAAIHAAGERHHDGLQRADEIRQMLLLGPQRVIHPPTPSGYTIIRAAIRLSTAGKDGEALELPAETLPVYCAGYSDP